METESPICFSLSALATSICPGTVATRHHSVSQYRSFPICDSHRAQDHTPTASAFQDWIAAVVKGIASQEPAEPCPDAEEVCPHGTWRVAKRGDREGSSYGGG